MIEHRTSSRQRVFKAGKIVLNKGRSVIDCSVRNVSATGAMITVANAATVPEEFELLLDGKMRACSVAWRRIDRLGVKFLSATAA